MNQEDVVDPQVPAESGDLGKKIQRAREAKNMSQVDLADKLNLSAKIIENLEQENFDDLPAPAFVRGYVRAIAIHLDLDVDDALATYAKQKPEDPSLGSTSSTEKQRKSSDPVMVWGTVGILVLVIILLIVWGLNTLGSKEAEDETIQETTETVDPAVNLDLIAPVIEVTVEEGEAAEVEAEDSEGAIELQAPSENTPASINPQAPQGQDQLTVSATGPSWADIRDANDFKLVYGLIDKNDEKLVVKGVAPFTVFLGDATQVKLQFQNKDYDHSRFIRSNKVAKFKIQ